MDFNLSKEPDRSKTIRNLKMINRHYVVLGLSVKQPNNDISLYSQNSFPEFQVTVLVISLLMISGQSQRICQQLRQMVSLFLRPLD